MRPILFVLPGSGLRIHSYGVMIFVACAAALMMAVWRARREKVDPNAVYELATWLFLGGVIGARAFYFVQHPEAFHEPSDLFRTWQGGNVFYGCILGGLTGSILYWLRRPFPFWRMADAVAPAVAIGAAVGRIGCFLNGCCHGAVCDVPWAVRFPAGSHAWARQVNDGLISTEARVSLPVHPTQLYSFAGRDGRAGVALALRTPGSEPGQGHGTLDDRLLRDPLADRILAERRARRVCRNDLVAEHQRGLDRRRPGVVVQPAAAGERRPRRNANPLDRQVMGAASIAYDRGRRHTGNPGQVTGDHFR